MNHLTPNEAGDICDLSHGIVVDARKIFERASPIWMARKTER
jgi:hypothetical protein